MAFARITLATGTLITQLFLQKIIPRYSRKIKARYDFDNNEIPVQENIQRRFEEVLNDINLVYRPIISKQYITLFNIHDIEIFHAGATCLKNGILGIPINFEYNDINRINNETISIQSASLQWDVEATKEFHNSLVLSENAQKFAIARQILLLANLNLIYKVFNTFLNLSIGIGVYDILRLQLKITKQQRGKNVLCMSISAIGVLLFTSLANRQLDYCKDKEINEIISKLGDKYIQGGIEYYEKLLQKNRALRILLGSKGTYMYTPVGNQTTWFTQNKIPISEQIDYFKQKMQNIQLKLV